MNTQAHSIEDSKPLIVFIGVFTALVGAYMLILMTAFVS